MFLSKAKRIFFILIVLVSALYAENKNNPDLDQIIDGRKADDFSKYLRKNPDVVNTRFGEKEDTILMEALKENKDISYIKILCQYSNLFDYTNKDGQNVFSILSIYSHNQENIKFVLNKIGKAKVNRGLIAQDNEGKTALDYAYDCPNYEFVHIAEIYTEVWTDNQIEEYQQNKIKKQEETAQKLKEEEEAKKEELTTKEEIVIEASKSPTLSSTRKLYLYDYLDIEEDDIPEPIENKGESLVHIEDPDKRDLNGRTLLMNAVKNGNQWEVKSLLQSGADVNLVDTEGWSALMYGLRFQNSVEVIDLLLKKGAKTDIKNLYGASPLQIAAIYSKNPDVLKRILKEYKSGQQEVFKSFILAITSNDGSYITQEAKIKLFIDYGVAINRFYEGKTPLMYAAEFCSSTGVLEILLDNGALPSIRSANGKKAFDYASLNTQLEHNNIYWTLNSQ